MRRRAIRFADPMAIVQGNQALIDLTCALAGPCPGRVRLQNGPAPGATVAVVGVGATSLRPAAKGNHLITYAAARFKLAGGQTQMLVVQRRDSLLRRGSGAESGAGDAGE